MADRENNNIVTETQLEFRSITQELSHLQNVMTKGKSDAQSIFKTATQLRNLSAKLSTDMSARTLLSEKEQNRLLQRLQTGKEILEQLDSYRDVMSEIELTEEERAELARGNFRSLEDHIENLISSNQLGENADNLLEDVINMIPQLDAIHKLQRNVVEEFNKSKKAVEETNEYLGSSYDLVNEIGNKLGLKEWVAERKSIKKSLAESIKAEDIAGQEEAKRRLEESGSIIAAIGKNLLGWVTSFKVLGAIKNSFNNLDKEFALYVQQTGDVVSGFDMMWKASVDTYQSLASSVDYLKTATELSKQIGLNIEGIFSGGQIAAAAEFKNLTGASAEETNNLLIRSRLVGQSTDQYRDALVAGANEGNKINKSTVTLKEIQNGVLQASTATALSYSNSANHLAQAVVAAKNLGMELSGIEKISESLLAFDSSIESEMSAQLLTGMQINLTKAREYALGNDLEGVAREIANQGMTAEKFAGMNRIQQEGMAKALGMSRDELAKSLILRQLNNGASAEALARATNMKKEQIEAMSAADKWNKSVEKLKESFAPILKGLSTVVELLAWMLRAVAHPIGGIVMGIAIALASIFKLVGGTVSLLKNVGAGGGLLGGLGRKSGEIAETATNSLSKLKNPNGKRVGSGLVSFFHQMGSVVVRRGIVNTRLLLLAAPGLAMFSVAALAASIFTGGGFLLKVLGRGLAAFFRSLGTAASNPMVWLGVLLLDAFAVALVGFGGAVALIGSGIKSIFEGVGTFFRSLPSLASAAKSASMGDMVGFLAGLGIGLWTFGKTGLPTLRKLSRMGNGLSTVASAVSLLAVSLKSLGESLSAFSEDKLDNLERITSNFSDVPENGTISTNAGKKQVYQTQVEYSTTVNLERVENLLDRIDRKLGDGFGVYMDSYKVGQTMAIGKYR